MSKTSDLLEQFLDEWFASCAERRPPHTITITASEHEMLRERLRAYGATGDIEKLYNVPVQVILRIP